MKITIRTPDGIRETKVTRETGLRMQETFKMLGWDSARWFDQNDRIVTVYYKNEEAVIFERA